MITLIVQQSAVTVCECLFEFTSQSRNTYLLYSLLVKQRMGYNHVVTTVGGTMVLWRQTLRRHNQSSRQGERKSVLDSVPERNTFIQAGTVATRRCHNPLNTSCSDVALSHYGVSDVYYVKCQNGGRHFWIKFSWTFSEVICCASKVSWHKTQ